MDKFFSRSRKGTSAAEIPVGILFLFVFLLMPLIDLGTVALRTSMVYTAAHDAMQAARRARSFKANTSNPASLSAVNSARQVAADSKGRGLKGVLFEDSDVSVRIIGIPTRVESAAINTSEPLTELKPNNYIYQIEVVIKAEVEPLITLNHSLFGNIQGLTQPLPITAEFLGLVESPEGLIR